MINAFKYKTVRRSRIFKTAGRNQLQVITEIVEGDLATKQDLHTTAERLEHKMLQMEYRMIIKIGTIITIALGAFATLVKLI